MQSAKARNIASKVVMYVVLPSRKIKLRQQLAGAMFAAIWWMLMSKLFNWYVDSYVAKTFTYGSLTMAILLMFWLYFGVLAIFIGGQINVFLERTDNLKTIIKNDGSSPQFLEIQPERKFNIHKKNKKNKKSADNSNGKESDDDKSDDEETVSKKSADEQTEPDLSKLKKHELLEILLAQSREIDKLRDEVADLESQLANREFEFSKIGSIAEASLAVTNIFKEAEKSAVIYLENIRRRCETKE